MQYQSVKSVKSIGIQDTLDFEVDHPDHNFYGEGIVISNSHATAYSKLTALTIYLKWKYPKLFFLESVKKAHKDAKTAERMAEIIPELRYFNINLLPPDVIKSDTDFVLEGNDIRYGISAIKGVKNQTRESILQLRYLIDREKANKFQIFHAAKEAKINISKLTSLIQCGCLASMGSDRSRMVLEAQIWSKLSPRERNHLLVTGGNYGYDVIVALKDYVNWHDGKVFKADRLETIRRDTAPYFKIFRQNTMTNENENLVYYIYERALLHYSFTTSLRDIFDSRKRDLQTCDEVKNSLDAGDSVYIVAHVTEVFKKKNKHGFDYIRLLMTDETGQLDCKMSAEKTAQYLAANPLPKKDDILLIEGSKDRMFENGVWINRLECQNFKVYVKTADLKKDTDNQESDEESETSREV